MQRLTQQEAAHKRSVAQKPQRMIRFLPLIQHPRFEEAVDAISPMQRWAITAYLKPGTTFKTIGDDMKLGAADAQRYFTDGMKKIAHLLK